MIDNGSMNLLYWVNDTSSCEPLVLFYVDIQQVFHFNCDICLIKNTHPL